jgi:hypothetical protein
MQTTQTTEMIVWLEKKARRLLQSFAFLYNLTIGVPTVWIGPQVVKELKRIVESSEITK